MKRIGIVFTFLLLSKLMFSSEAPLSINVVSEELSSVTGQLNIQVQYTCNQNLVLHGIPFISLPDSWSVMSTPDFDNQSFAAGDVIDGSIVVAYPTTEIPYYYQTIHLSQSVNSVDGSIGSDFLDTEIKIYFTPYNTVEVWSGKDFYLLKREWMVSNGSPKTRVFVAETDIPISDIPTDFDYNENWMQNHESIAIEGLAYKIPMNSLVTDHIGNEGAGLKQIGKRYRGTISGTINAPVLADRDRASANPIWINRSMEGIEVELFETDFGVRIKSLGTTVTLADGSFSVYVNDLFKGELGKLEIEAVVRSRNSDIDFTVYRYSDVLLGIKPYCFTTDNTDWPYNDENNLNLSIGTYTLDVGAIRTTNFITKAYKFCYESFGSYPTPRLDVYMADDTFMAPNSICGIGLASVFGPTVADLVGDRPMIFMEMDRATGESTCYHEFGHYVMWWLQHRCYIASPAITITHWMNRMNHTWIAFTEGWAHFFGIACDAHYHNFDNESTFRRMDETFEYRNPSLSSAIDPITNGARSEYYIACALYDLWDGPNNLSHIPSLTPIYYNDVFSDGTFPLNYNNAFFWEPDQVDDVEYSLAEIGGILSQNSTGSEVQIKSIQDFFYAMIEGKSCSEVSKIKKVFDQNIILADITDPETGFTTDIIDDDDLNLHHTGARQISTPFFPVVLTFDYFFDQKVDKQTLDGSIESFNYGSENGENGHLSDDLLVQNGAGLFFNKYTYLEWFNDLGATSGDPKPMLDNTFNVDLCGGMKLELSTNGIMEVGDASQTCHANVSLENEGIIIVDGTSELKINNNSTLTIESGATLVIRSGGIVNLNGNGRLVIKSGAYLCIEAGYVMNNPGDFILHSGFIVGKHQLHEDVEGECMPYNCGTFITNPSPVVVSGVESWNNITGNNIFLEDITITSSGHLSINNSTLKLSSGVDIIVESGGKLVLNHTTLTNNSDCNSMWKGITIKGNTSVGQIPYLQGSLYLSNDSEIKNALIGVKVLAGGIVIANAAIANDPNVPSCNFINCQKSLVANPNNSNYSNTSISKLEKCTFSYSGSLINGGLMVSNMVELYNWDGFEFKGCRFVVTDDCTLPTDERPTGIYSENSSFTVKENCESITFPCTNNLRSEFTGLNYAIHATTESNIKQVNISYTDFINNNRDALLEGQLLRAEFLLNNFNKGQLATGSLPPPDAIICDESTEEHGDCYDYWQDVSYCIYLNGCTGYNIQENMFTTVNLAGVDYTVPGILVRGTGEYPNQIYNNTFDKLSVATVAIGQNSGGWYAQGRTTGLKYKCNDFKDNIYAISTRNGSIAADQVDYDAEINFNTPPGNTFDHLYAVSDDYNAEFSVTFSDNNWWEYKYDYYYYPNNPETKPNVEYSYPLYVENKAGDIATFVKNEACPSLVSKSPNPIPMVINDFVSVAIALSDFQDDFDVLLDGGQTNTIKSAIKDVTPNNFNDMCQKLIANGEYNSPEVLRDFMKCDINGRWPQKRNVLESASPLPYSAKVEFEQYDMPNPFKKQIEDLQIGVSFVDEKLREIETLKSEKIILLEEALNYYFSKDSLGDQYSILQDSVIQLFMLDDSYTSSTMLFPFLNSTGRTSEASQLLNQLESQIEDAPIYKQQHLREYVDFYRIMLLAKMDPTEHNNIIEHNHSFLEALAVSDNYYISVSARLALENAGLRDYPELIQLPPAPKFTENLTINGTVYENADCGGSHVEGISLVLLNENHERVSSVSPAVTDANGEFEFNFFQIDQLDNTAYYYIASSNGLSINSYDLLMIDEWSHNSLVFELDDVSRYWVRKYNGTDSLHNTSTTIDLSGNLYVAGTSQSATTGYDYVVIKYNPMGDEIWSTTYNGSGSSSDWTTAMVVDINGNCYVTGMSSNSSNNNDYSTIKLNPDGYVLWENRFDGSSTSNNSDVAQSIAVDVNGNVFVTGNTRNIAGNYDIQTIAYDTHGNTLWQSVFDNANSQDEGRKIAIDLNGNVYVAGVSNLNYLLLKYDIDGNELWNISYDYGLAESLNDLIVDEAGNAYITGWSKNINNEIATIKYNADGLMQWTKRYSSSVSASGSAIALDGSGNVIVTGTANDDFVTIKYSNNGQQLWASSYAGPMNRIDQAVAITIDEMENIYITGNSSPTISKSGDIVTIKYAPDGSKIWLDIYYSLSIFYSRGNDIIAGSNNNVYMTGHGHNGSNFEILTIKYAECASTADLKNAEVYEQEDQPTEPTGVQFNIFPNPNDGNMELVYFFSNEENGKLVITSIQGTVVADYNLSGKNTKGWINNDQLSNGVYFYNIYQSSKMINSGKIVIVK